MDNKELIEVVLPLEVINKKSAREKSIRHGHPSTLHLWWTRRPLAAVRAAIWSSLVDAPSSHPEVLDAAKTEIMKSTGGDPPALLDPFAGGKVIPLEAQWLGLEAHARDLNPMAVMIKKAMIEIPPRFAGQPLVYPGKPPAWQWRDWWRM